MFGRKQDNEATDSPFWKQRGWIFSAVFLATVLLVATVSYISDAGGDEANAAAQHRKPRSGPLPTQEAQGGKRATAEERPKGCRTEDDKGEDTARPTSAPKDVAWKNLNDTLVPTSPSAGPTQVSGPVWWCYARTPMGAVMAAHSILTHMSDADWRTVAEQQIVSGKGREEFISQRSAMSQAAVESEETGVYSGFSVVSYSKNAAELRILIKSAGGTLGSTTVSMRWSGGDWKVKPRTNGALFTSSTSAMSSGGFIKWGAA
ncbi:hypothetical protein ACTWQF_05855 [Streptomyces sp. 8N114]|uniref:hypothetical protein n=1 Tax=Streptomyces sp. 8N114 TaxID=3457419 RepID=UPI003FD1B735